MCGPCNILYQAVQRFGSSSHVETEEDVQSSTAEHDARRDKRFTSTPSATASGQRRLSMMAVSMDSFHFPAFFCAIG